MADKEDTPSSITPSVDGVSMQNHVINSSNNPVVISSTQQAANTNSSDIDSQSARRPQLAAISTQVSGQAQDASTSQLPRSIPRTPSLLGPGAAITSQSDASPTSPRGRDRGYSLRRQLFHRNAHVQADSESGPSSPIELRPVSRAGSGKGNISVKWDELSKRLPSRGEDKVDVYNDDDSQGKRRPSIQQRQNTRLQRLNELFHVAKEYILRPRVLPASSNGRRIPLSVFRNRAKTILVDERTDKPYMDNTIRSSRYTLWNFLPRQLFAQFSKLANFYFLLVSILQMIPSLSTTGTYTTIIPLLIFVSISMGKEAYDDYRRYKQDRLENRKSRTRVLSLNANHSKSTAGDNYHDLMWQDLRVGDIIKLNRDEAVPADIIILDTNGINGVAYVETSALDGETNLKSKQALPFLSEYCHDLSSVPNKDMEMIVEDPNNDLYNFEGKVTAGSETKPLTNTQILYRGSVLRNTPSIRGLVIFTGEETKIRMNANKRPRIKAPALQSAVNKVVVLIVFFVLFLTVYHTVAYVLWRDGTERKSWYLAHATVGYFPIFTSFLIMFNTLIPLSLYVSLEIIKVGQMLLFGDIDMYDEKTDTPMEAHTSTINEELGQVSYIFTDKTGTLTDNSMIFRKISIAGYAWLHDLDMQKDEEKVHLWHKRRHKDKGKKKAHKTNTRKSVDVLRATIPQKDKTGIQITTQPIDGPDIDAAHPRRSSVWRSTARPEKAQPQLTTINLINYLQTHPHTLYARKARTFLLALSLCHTCLPELDVNGEIVYQAASPDEIALVVAAKELGYIVVDRTMNQVTIKTFPAGLDEAPQIELYDVLDVIEFSSKRKRMSIILRYPDSKICILSKGADSTMIELLRKSELALAKMREVEKRERERKSLDAQEYIRRSMHRPSMQAAARRSLAAGRTSIDSGFRRRGTVDHTSSSNMYSPVSAVDNYNRFSIAIGEATTPLERDTSDDVIDDMVAANDSLVFERCFQHVQDFATEGLRTLLYGYKYLDEQEYASWKTIYTEATTSLVDRQIKIEAAAELIEGQFELAGATAIEDKLQDGVPNAIDKLRRAGIKLWMLTGDKRETAINIGHSCRLIRDYSTVTVLDKDKGNLESQIAETLYKHSSDDDIAHTVVVIDGATLAEVEKYPETQSLFFELTITVDSVICCRASPSQKAALVNSIRRKVSGSITLAIGDGANDIAMIQEAHVGIGITGKEGLAAARSSDYSIAQFRFLLKLLLVHGRWNYVRTCKYVLATFWKEMLFYLTQACYQRWNGYTGTSVYESWSISMFNTLFTSLPVIFLGIFEKDLAAPTLLAVPELYVFNRKSLFNIKTYIAWISRAVVQAILVFYVTFGLFEGGYFLKYNDLFPFGQVMFTAVVVFVSTKLQVLEMHNKSVMAVVSFVCSVGGWFLWNILLDIAYHDVRIYDAKHALFQRFGKDLFWWMVLFIVVASCVILDLAITTIRVAFWPNEIDDFQAIEQDPVLRKRLEEAASDELQAGWLRGSKKTSFEIQREAEIEDLLNQPRIMTAQKSGSRRDSCGV